MKVSKVKREVAKVKKDVKENVVRLRMTNSDLKNLKKISRQLKVTDSQAIRLLIESKANELNKQKDIFE